MVRFFVLACLLLVSCLASGTSEEAPLFKKMRVKALRALLDDRGVSSEGIVEKDDLVKLATESWPLPIVEKAQPEPEPPVGNLEPDEDDMANVLKALKEEKKKKARVLKNLKKNHKKSGFSGGMFSGGTYYS